MQRRWHATATYRSDAGPVDVQHDFDELSDLHDLIERGPHWDTIDQIVIRRGEFIDTPDLTIEEAEKL